MHCDCAITDSPSALNCHTGTLSLDEREQEKVRAFRLNCWRWSRFPQNGPRVIDYSAGDAFVEKDYHPVSQSWNTILVIVPVPHLHLTLYSGVCIVVSRLINHLAIVATNTESSVVNSSQ